VTEYPVKPTLDAVGVRMIKMLKEIEICQQMINKAFGETGHRIGENDNNARAWDYLDALAEARYTLLNRVETWDNFYEENVR
jgi:hypothetical protein